jgi:hypothetical protein
LGGGFHPLNSFATYNGFLDAKVLKKNFEPADIKVAVSELLRNRFPNTDQLGKYNLQEYFGNPV